MKHLYRLLHSIRLQHCRTLPLTKAVVTTAIVLSTMTLVALQLCQLKSQAKIDALQEQAAHLERENAALSQQVENIDRLDSIRQIAAQELNLVNPDTIIIEESE